MQYTYLQNFFSPSLLYASSTVCDITWLHPPIAVGLGDVFLYREAESMAANRGFTRHAVTDLLPNSVFLMTPVGDF